ncbi:MAG TPA: AMP-binding protein [Desulfobacteraceae bacterium]|nr:AMP-binding protein [Desulfobacteraceae bacterium]HPJ66512.1 AMP-binding protein [Desulfobacteraceae bacterium]HPQ28518.1 AMP-binding protein [Desulfobacteraceae bacterium]
MPLPNELVITGFHRACEKYPDRTAVIYLGEKFSYSRLSELIDRFADALYDLGVRDNDKVMIYIPNCPQFLIGYLGAQQIGAVPVPVSPIYTPHEIRYLINDAGAETVLCQDTNFRYIKEVFSDTCLKRAIVTNYVDLIPLYKRVFGFLFDKVPNGVIEKGESIFSFKSLICRKFPKAPRADINPDEHLSYILYTGGTTGFPKGCIATHSGMVSFVNEIRDIGKDHILDGEEIFIMVNPLFHQLAQGIILGMVLTKGNTAVLMPIPQVDAILDAIRRHKGTLFLGAPALYRMILENDRLDLFDLSSLKYCWSGGDVLPLEVYNRWKMKFNLPIYQVYGSTEVGFTAMSPLDREPVPGSVGMPLPSRKTMIVDPESLEPVPPGTPGELLVTSEFISKCYWNKPEETAASYVEIEGTVWYRMKDYVRRDSDGQLFYVDRSADVIKHKGYRVSCSEIEAILQDNPAVVGACVVGVPDTNVGERIKAIVVLKEDVRGVSGTELTKWCRERLASYKVPQYVEFRDMLPKSKVGKLLRREIRDEERRRTSEGKG